MSSVILSETQILNSLDTLSPEGRRQAIRKLVPSAAWLEQAVARNRPRIETLARQRGLDWNTLSEEQREQLIDEVLHE